MLTRKNHYLAFGGVLLSLIAIIAGATALTRRPKPVTLPEETAITVTLDQGLASDQNRSGDHFGATVSEPVVFGERTVIPQGAHVEGLVVDARPSGRLRGRARLQLTIESIDVNGKTYPLQTDASRKSGGNHKKRNWAWIAGGGGGGLLVGALAGGGKGALIGGPIGAGAGTLAAYMTGKKDIHLNPETRLTFHLAQPATIDVRS